MGGTLTREFKHIQLDILMPDPETVRVDMWFGKRKSVACIRTICSHIENMITGVTKGYLYKMRFVYSHFPINVTLTGRMVEIRNARREARAASQAVRRRRVRAHGGCEGSDR